ncbi:hypothetical protein LTR56_007644 [Elasticomyces elasticus]|nr:hypothetical protein LTR56_007644 [Elasticomyces elasticus]KAK3665345.1 hypothetical protein LTR22_003867 [Elasticomyces elasticus]KAK4929682.1 hypothetical protein LTR49_003640 [Elasticomyces elasticus]KAK5761098.1 hypothetical protein LTS12_008775 [Elasticomyces elasticus]
MGREVRGRHAKGCAPLEKLPVELLKMIMEYSLDFTTPPVPEVLAGVRKEFDYFGLYTDYEYATCILFTSLEGSLKAKSLGRSRIQSVHVKDLCAPRLISRALLAPATEAMLGGSTSTNDKGKTSPGPKCLSRPKSKLGDRNRFWDNDFFFPHDSKGVARYLEQNINRPTYIERFTITNDCMPPTFSHDLRTPQSFLEIFRHLAFAKKTQVIPFMVVCRHSKKTSDQRLRRYLGSVTSTATDHESVRITSHKVAIHRRPWYGIGSCNAQVRQSKYAANETTDSVEKMLNDDDLLTYGFDDGDVTDDDWDSEDLRERWTYFQYDARWADLFADDLKLLVGRDVVGGVWSRAWKTVCSRY